MSESKDRPCPLLHPNVHMCVCAWSKTPITPNYGILIWQECDCWLTSPGFVGQSVCTHKFAHVFYCLAGLPLDSGGLQRPLTIRLNGRARAWSAEEGCAPQDGWGDIQGDGVDGCPPFVLQIRGNLLAIVAPCLLAIQRAERGDFSSAEPMTSSFCSKWFSLGPSLALLSFLSFLAVAPHCSGCGQARLAMVS